MATIKHLILENPNGLLTLKNPLSINAYRENFGFSLKNVCTIYRSPKVNDGENEWFKFPVEGRTLENLFSVQEESEEGKKLVVFIVERIFRGQVHCELVLSDEAYNKIMQDKTQQVLKVHQMYTSFLGNDYIALNTEINTVAA